MGMSVDTKLGFNVFKSDKESHIKNNKEICGQCTERVCLYVCPARVYRLGENNEVVLMHEACLECGTCKIACTRGALTWRYPESGAGVQFRFG